MPKVLLTDMVVRNLKPPATGQQTYWDRDLTGFGLRISQGGARTWIMLDPRSRVRSRQTIGRYPLLALKQAREECRKRLAAQVLGATQPRSVAWNIALETYLAEVKEKRKPRTHADYKRLLERHFRFADTKLSDITPEMIDRKIAKLSGTPAEQQHAFVVLRAFLKWCYRKSYIDRNPMDRMEEPKGYAARDRVLTDNELKKVWNALEDNTFGRIVKLLILTGQRENEIANLTRDMIGEWQITLPATLTKNSREHVLPISSLGRSILQAASEATTSQLLFHALGRPESTFNGWSKCKAALDRRSSVTNWRLHDLRRTYATNLQRLGVKHEVIECLLNHISGYRSGVAGVYQRHTFLPEMREAVEIYEKWLQSLLSARVNRDFAKLPNMGVSDGNGLHYFR